MVHLLCFDLKEIFLQRHKWRHRDASRGDRSDGGALCLAPGKQSLHLYHIYAIYIIREIEYKW